MAYRKKTGLKTILTFAVILTVGAIFKNQIMNLVAKVPFLGDFVKDLSDKQDSTN